MPSDPFGDLFGDNNPFLPKTPAKKKPEKGVPWEAKIIDGLCYVPLHQVAEMLKINEALPAVRAGIERRVEQRALDQKFEDS